jgi:hypothetical protein
MRLRHEGGPVPYRDDLIDCCVAEAAEVCGSGAADAGRPFTRRPILTGCRRASHERLQQRPCGAYADTVRRLVILFPNG